MNDVLSKSAVVRARYLPDVNGVNRYKYFHRPLILDEMSVVCGESIDKKMPRGSQQQRNRDLLPPIRPNAARASSTVAVEKHKASSSAKSSVMLKKNTRPNEAALNKVKRSSKVKQLQKSSVTVPNATASSSVLPPITSKSVKLYAIKCFNSTWPNYEALSNDRSHGSKNLRVVEDRNNANKVKRTQSVNSLSVTDSAFLNGHSQKIRPSSYWSQRLKPVFIKDFGTQTELVPESMLAPKIVTPDSATQSSSAKSQEKVNTPKATQTNNLAVLTKLSVHSNKTLDEIEQRSKLLEIVDEALEQTIDKNSRQRVNELIALSARKQVEVWRDAKDFVSSILLPQSVALANRFGSKPTKSPTEIIAKIHLP